MQNNDDDFKQLLNDVKPPTTKPTYELNDDDLVRKYQALMGKLPPNYTSKQLQQQQHKTTSSSGIKKQQQQFTSSKQSEEEQVDDLLSQYIQHNKLENDTNEINSDKNNQSEVNNILSQITDELRFESNGEVSDYDSIKQYLQPYENEKFDDDDDYDLDIDL
jgi:small-conductance mechanosensitive channel